MARTFDVSNVSRRQFLAVAGSVAAASSLAVGKNSGSTEPSQTPTPLPPAPAPRTIIVTIDVTKPNWYSYKDNLNATGDANILNVNSGDQVTWKATTSATHHHGVILFPNGTPFVKSGNPEYAFCWSEKEEGNNLVWRTIQGDANRKYEYSVAVFDDDNNLTYADDPKIIVGSGNLDEKLAAARSDLKAAANDAKRRNEKELEDKIEDIKKQLQHLIEEKP